MPPSGVFISMIRNIAPEVESAHITSAVIVVPLRGANRPNVPKRIASHDTRTRAALLKKREPSRGEYIVDDLQGPRLQLTLEVGVRREFLHLTLECFAAGNRLGAAQFGQLSRIAGRHRRDRGLGCAFKRAANLLRLRTIVSQHAIKANDSGSTMQKLRIHGVERAFCR